MPDLLRGANSCLGTDFDECGVKRKDFTSHSLDTGQAEEAGLGGGRHVTSAGKKKTRSILSGRVEAHAHTIEVSFGGWSRAPRDLEELPNGSLERGLAYPGSSTWLLGVLGVGGGPVLGGGSAGGVRRPLRRPICQYAIGAVACCASFIQYRCQSEPQSLLLVLSAVRELRGA